jgi:hypothetical protein
MTEPNTHPTSFLDAIRERNIYDPNRDGIEYSADQLNWASKEYYLPTGDCIGVFKQPQSSLYKIDFVSKTAPQRRLPSAFEGLFTSPSFAQKVIYDTIKDAWADADARRVVKPAKVFKNEDFKVLKNEDFDGGV